MQAMTRLRLDAVTLWMRGDTGTAILYVLASVAGSLAALAAGLWLGGFLTR